MQLTPAETALIEGERAEYAEILRAIRHPVCPVVTRGLQLICVGNSGGATSVVHGNPSGGFILRYAGRTVMVDPGDNAVSSLAQSGFNPFEITDVLASHAHNDHVGDLSLAVSAAINLGLTHETDARIIVAPTLADYSNATATRFGFALPSYAWKAHVDVLYFESRQTTRFDGVTLQARRSTEIPGGIRVSATEARHGGTPATGFVFETGLGKVGYTGDSEYFEGLHTWFDGVDVLWINMNTLALDAMVSTHSSSCKTPKPTHNHLGYVGVCRLIEEVGPRTAVISHFGAQLHDQRAGIEAALRDRFTPAGVNIFCPENLQCLDFQGPLTEKPTQNRFPI
jgi:ribonuclease BN (tRNA processing enzyme)